MLVWLTLPFYDFCGFRSVAVNSVYKLQFCTFIYSMTSRVFGTFYCGVARACEVQNYQHGLFAGEANRLVASLVKNSAQCKDVMLMVTRCGALPHLVRMTAAEHLVMQNEAVVALTILVTILTGNRPC